VPVVLAVSSEFFATTSALLVTGGFDVLAGGAAVTGATVFAAVATGGVTVTVSGLMTVAVTAGGFSESTSREGGGFFSASDRLMIGAGGFMATVTLGEWAVSVTENALSTIAHAKIGDFQRCGDIEQKAPAFRQELGVRAVYVVFNRRRKIMRKNT
jgi:hypothetical protein